MHQIIICLIHCVDIKLFFFFIIAVMKVIEKFFLYSIEFSFLTTISFTFINWTTSIISGFYSSVHVHVFLVYFSKTFLDIFNEVEWDHLHAEIFKSSTFMNEFESVSHLLGRYLFTINRLKMMKSQKNISSNFYFHLFYFFRISFYIILNS